MRYAVKAEEGEEGRGGEEILSLYLLEISLVLAFIAAAYILRRSALMLWFAGDMFRDDLYCAMPAAKRA